MTVTTTVRHRSSLPYRSELETLSGLIQGVELDSASRVCFEISWDAFTGRQTHVRDVISPHDLYDNDEFLTA